MKQYVWTEEQKKALLGSIKKWEKIVKGEQQDKGKANCPCCEAFWVYKECTECPVRLFTGKWGCIDTPYANVLGNKPSKIDASAEKNFLKAVYLAGGGK